MKYLLIAMAAIIMIFTIQAFASDPQKEACREYIALGQHQKFDQQCSEVDWTIEEWLQIEELDKLNRKRRINRVRKTYS
jgi:hypothetical protein